MQNKLNQPISETNNLNLNSYMVASVLPVY